MSEQEGIHAAIEQMNYEIVNNGVMDLPVSEPCTFSFTSDATLSEDAFKTELNEHDFATIDTYSQESGDDFYYKTKVMTDHYKDCVVKVWRREVRIFPREEQLDRFEISRVVHAIEDAFGAELEHTKND